MQRGKDEMRATDDKIDVSEGEHVVKVVGSINGLQYCQYRNEEEYTDSIISAVFKLVCLDLMWEDTQTKGRLKIHQAVVEMFASSPPRTRFHNVRAIGLYGIGGIGGIGKTTKLAKSIT